MKNQEEEPAFEQASLWGELEQGEVIEYGNCTVMNEPKLTRLKNGTLLIWECTIEVHPDLFHMEQAGTYYLHAQQEKAAMAQKARLKPGDRAQISAIPLPTQEVILGNGEKQVFNHLSVTNILVLSRAPRISTTTFEKRRGW